MGDEMMRRRISRRTPAAAILLLLAMTGCGPRTQVHAAGEWRDLFNGRDLSGWDLKIRGSDLNENYRNTFRVEDGLLRVRYDDYETFDDRFGHLFYEEQFSHYRLIVEYRFVGAQVPGGPAWAIRNNGVMLHSQSAASMQRNQNFPVSIEAQLLGGDGTNDRTTANVCSPGTHIHRNGQLVTEHCVNSTSPTFQGDQWVTVEFLVLGDELVQHIIGGEVVFEYHHPVVGGTGVNDFDPAVKQDGTALDRGYIAVQAESHPTDFRSIRILNLRGCMDASSPAYRSYFVADDPSACTSR
jgi:hypothetical protein